MTRKHYIALASVLNDYQHMMDEDVFEALVADVAEICDRDNPRLDWTRFHAACVENN